MTDKREESGCILFMVLMVIVFFINAFVFTTLKRLDNLEKAAGIERYLPMDERMKKAETE